MKNRLTKSKNNMKLTYLQGYPESTLNQVETLISSNTLKAAVLNKFPHKNRIRTSKELYNYTIELKKRYFKKSSPIAKVEYTDRAEVLKNALGLHYFIPRVQGKKIKSKNEIKVSSVFINGAQEFLEFIVVHELAHLKEKEHNKAFYALCNHMMPTYHEVELYMRLFLTCHDLYGEIY